MSSSHLHELERLTRIRQAVLRITIDQGVTTAAFKERGSRAEIVCAHDLTPPDEILGVLLYRLGHYHDLPTTEDDVARMTDRQREKCRALLLEIKAIRDEARTQIAEVEPVLASPRSSLDQRAWPADAVGGYDGD